MKPLGCLPILSLASFIVLSTRVFAFLAAFNRPPNPRIAVHFIHKAKNLSAAEKRDIFHDTAVRTYKLDEDKNQFYAAKL